MERVALGRRKSSLGMSDWRKCVLLTRDPKVTDVS